MKILKVVSVFAIATLFVACGNKSEKQTETAEVQEVVDPGKYKNNHLGISLQYDPEVLVLQDAPENSDEVVFNAATGKAKLRIYKDTRTDKNGEPLAFTDAFEADKLVKPGHKIGHGAITADAYTISGRVGDELYYQKTIYKRGGLITAILTYPDEEKDVYNTLYIPLFGSFE